jgi:hypothetical protein
MHFHEPFTNYYEVGRTRGLPDVIRDPVDMEKPGGGAGVAGPGVRSFAIGVLSNLAWTPAMARRSVGGPAVIRPPTVVVRWVSAEDLLFADRPFQGSPANAGSRGRIEARVPRSRALAPAPAFPPARNDDMIIVRAPSDGDMDVGMFDISMIDGDPVEVGPRSRSASSIRSRVRLCRKARWRLRATMSRNDAGPPRIAQRRPCDRRLRSPRRTSGPDHHPWSRRRDEDKQDARKGARVSSRDEQHRL